MLKGLTLLTDLRITEYSQVNFTKTAKWFKLIVGIGVIVGQELQYISSDSRTLAIPYQNSGYCDYCGSSITLQMSATVVGQLEPGMQCFALLTVCLTLLEILEIYWNNFPSWKSTGN